MGKQYIFWVWQLLINLFGSEGLKVFLTAFDIYNSFSNQHIKERKKKKQES